jgi:hypothetical protein
MAIYFPVLRWKQGEQHAILNLSETIKSKINPIIEFPPGCDCNDPRFTNFSSQAVKFIGKGLPFYLDFSSAIVPPETELPHLRLFDEAAQSGLELIPVITSSIEEDLFNVVKQGYQSEFFKNLAFRIADNEEDAIIIDTLNIIQEFGIERSHVDLIIDLCDISSGAIQSKLRGLQYLTQQFDQGYRKTIVLSGAMPSDISNFVGRDEDGTIPRHDWSLWRRAHRQSGLQHQLFGDYTIIPYEFREVQFAGAPKIRYTLENEWHIIKGHKQRGRDSQRQMQATKIMNLNSFRGEENSYGENRIVQCANGSWGPGNMTNWVAIDINQHITFAVSQVSAIPDDV